MARVVRAALAALVVVAACAVARAEEANLDADFDAIDEDRSGQISRDEFHKYLTQDNLANRFVRAGCAPGAARSPRPRGHRGRSRAPVARCRT
jgi:hypothetical protein